MHLFRGLIIGAVLLAAAVPGRANDDPRSALKYFIGTWSCAGTAWTFAPFLNDPTWIRNVYGDPAKPDGSAILGYVGELKKYVYRDFHADGSYADITSDGLVDDRWVWTGPYYPAAGGVLTGRITYRIVAPDRYERTFESLTAGQLKTMGHDACVKRP